jgi:hypothetical protein
VSDLLGTGINKYLLPLVFSLGGQLFAGLLSRQRFRREFKRHKKSLVELQDLYNTLVWNKISPDSFDREFCNYREVGCFSWAELTTCTKLSIFSYSDVRDREALRGFLAKQEDFKGLVDYFKLPIDEAIEKVADIAIKHFYCMEVMYNFGNFGTNNGKHCKRFKFIQNTGDAFKLYCEKYNKRGSAMDNPHLMELLKACSK